jgi:4-hydroxy-tetrahydrodipicolinate reductase
MKKRVLLAGHTGRMGREIAALLEEDRDLKLSPGDLKSVSPSEVDVAVDFSAPEFSLKLADWCVKNSKPLVCGTTGFEEKEFKKLTSTSKKIPLLYAANMSLGVAVLRRILRELAPLAAYDFQISEVHHNKKKDKPGGTAKFLQAELEKVLKRKLPPVHATRGGGVVGIHEVAVLGDEETLTLTHRALQRRVFARGALLCAKFLVNRKPGLYSLDDVLDNQS